MEKLKSMKEMLMCCVEGQMSHLDSVDAQELGAAVDMIKDLSEAIYYCTITEAMEEKEGKEKEHHHYYTEKYYPIEYNRDMDRGQGRMYYDGGSSSGSGNNSGSSRNYSEYNYVPGDHDPSTKHYTEREYTGMMRDQREGRSPMSRKSYMESKEMHHTKATQMKELEKYLQELSTDITEMIEGASPEEKQLLEKKISLLANKISQTNA